MVVIATGRVRMTNCDVSVYCIIMVTSNLMVVSYTSHVEKKKREDG